ncbi:MAG: protein kinase [Polyangiaceae bacterium]|nr:protein kinase [Polyangiaceae bacterium]
MSKQVHSFGPGDVVGGDFRIVGKLAEGGMGVVFKAEQLSTRKLRAVKVMHPSIVGDERMRARFLQEAWVVARLESDHAVDVVAAGVESDSGVMWLAMELLRGETLDQFVARRGPLQLPELRELGIQLRHVLGQAHALGLVHRDLKPENLFVCAPRRSGVPFTVKILDFGIAKLLQESRSLENSQAMGSPLWMAPEQWRPNAPITPAADVWALALVLFFALSGRAYWRASTQQDFAQVVVEVVTAPIEPPSQRARELGADYPALPGFGAWFRHCLSRDPSERYADAELALAALDELFPPPAGGGPVARPSEPARVPLEHAATLTPPGLPVGEAAVRAQPSAPTTVREGAPPAARPSAPGPARPSRPAPAPRPRDELGGVPGGHALAQLWPAIAAPAWRHEDMGRVALALGPLLAEQSAIAPALAGLSEQWRTNRVSAQVRVGGRPAVAAAESALREASSRLGLPEPAVYFRPDERAPLRIESTLPLSFVLGPSLAELRPATVALLGAASAAVQRADLMLRAFVTDPAALRRTIAAALQIAQGRVPRPAAAVLLADLRAELERRPDVLVCLEEHGPGCTDGVIVEWLAGVDCTLARVGVTAVPLLDALDEALAHWPIATVARDAVRRDAAAWLEDPGHAEASAAWRSG